MPFNDNLFMNVRQAGYTLGSDTYLVINLTTCNAALTSNLRINDLTTLTKVGSGLKVFMDYLVLNYLTETYQTNLNYPFTCANSEFDTSPVYVVRSDNLAYPKKSYTLDFYSNVSATSNNFDADNTIA